MKKYIFALIIAVFTYSLANASTASKVRSGNGYYKKGEYEKSLGKYREAEISSPNNEAVHFNIGNSLHKTGDFDGASNEYRKAAASTKNTLMQSQVFYNLGNTAYRQGKYDEALEYYKKTLTLNPSDRDAKYNIEYMLKKKHENKKDKNKQQDKDKKQESKDKKNEEKSKENKSGMSKEDAQRILKVFDESDRDSAKKRKMSMPQIPKVEEDW